MAEPIHKEDTVKDPGYRHARVLYMPKTSYGKASKIAFGEDDMRKRINAYLAFIDKILAHDLPITSSFHDGGEHTDTLVKDTIPTRKDYEKLMELHLQQIAFFQHERLIHLLVTILFALLAFAVFILNYMELMAGRPNIALILLFILIVVLLVPYIMHYFLLENGVQKMYRQYDEMVRQIRS